MKTKWTKTVIWINIISFVVILIVIISLSMYYSSVKTGSIIFRKYTGNFGLYGKYLTLYCDSTFKFDYFGCSQNEGQTIGTWKIENNYLILEPKVKNDLLNEKHLIKDDKLLIIETDSIDFTLNKRPID